MCQAMFSMTDGHWAGVGDRHQDGATSQVGTKPDGDPPLPQASSSYPTARPPAQDPLSLPLTHRNTHPHIHTPHVCTDTYAHMHTH